MGDTEHGPHQGPAPEPTKRSIIAALVAVSIVAVFALIALAFVLGRETADSSRAVDGAAPSSSATSETPAPSGTDTEVASRSRAEYVSGVGELESRQQCGASGAASLEGADVTDDDCSIGFQAAVGGIVLGGAIEAYWISGRPWTDAEARQSRRAAWERFSGITQLGLDNEAEFNRGFALGWAWVNSQWQQTPWPRP